MGQILRFQSQIPKVRATAWKMEEEKPRLPSFEKVPVPLEKVLFEFRFGFMKDLKALVQSERPSRGQLLVDLRSYRNEYGFVSRDNRDAWQFRASWALDLFLILRLNRLVIGGRKAARFT